MQTTPTKRFAKRISAICALAALLLAGQGQSFAQANPNPPTKLTYQGFLTDQNGVPLGNTAPINKTVIFRIYDALTAGNKLWASQQTVTVDKGHFSVLLGEGSAVGSETFSSDLSSYFTNGNVSDRFLELTVDGTPIAPRLQFFAAPYALLATVARRANEVDGGGLTSGTVSDARLSANVAKLGSDQTFNGQNQFNNGIRVPNTKVIQLGSDVAGRDGAAGQIGYGTFSGGASLDIVGAGQNNTTRKIKMFAEGGAEVTGPVTATSFSGNGITPIGGIIMWSGAANAVPAGWALCNGQTVNGQVTPDLRNRFVVGAGGNYNPKDTGGASSITLSVAQLPPHNHTYVDVYFAENQGRNDGWYGSKSGYDQDNQPFSRNATTDNTGSGAAINIMPPYMALAYIMRVQ